MSAGHAQNLDPHADLAGNAGHGKRARRDRATTPMTSGRISRAPASTEVPASELHKAHAVSSGSIGAMASMSRSIACSRTRVGSTRAPFAGSRGVWIATAGGGPHAPLLEQPVSLGRRKSVTLRWRAFSMTPTTPVQAPGTSFHSLWPMDREPRVLGRRGTVDDDDRPRGARVARVERLPRRAVPMAAKPRGRPPGWLPRRAQSGQPGPCAAGRRGRVASPPGRRGRQRVRVDLGRRLPPPSSADSATSAAAPASRPPGSDRVAVSARAGS